MPRMIPNPLTLRPSTVSHVLRALAAQENRDGEPYDQMVEAARYIDELEGAIRKVLSALNAVVDRDGLDATALFRLEEAEGEAESLLGS